MLDPMEAETRLPPFFWPAFPGGPLFSKVSTATTPPHLSQILTLRLPAGIACSSMNVRQSSVDRATFSDVDGWTHVWPFCSKSDFCRSATSPPRACAFPFDSLHFFHLEPAGISKETNRQPYTVVAEKMRKSFEKTFANLRGPNVIYLLCLFQIESVHEVHQETVKSNSKSQEMNEHRVKN